MGEHLVQLAAGDVRRCDGAWCEPRPTRSRATVVAAVGVTTFGVVAATGSTRCSAEGRRDPVARDRCGAVYRRSEQPRGLPPVLQPGARGVGRRHRRLERWERLARLRAGSVSSAFLTAALRRLNYFRAMAGLSAVTFVGTDPSNPVVGTSSDPNNVSAQQSAVTGGRER